MRTIEAQLHELLLDIAPEQHTVAEQARVIAEASEVYSQIYANNKRVAGKVSESSVVHEAHMMDALLQALASYPSQDDDDDFGADYVNGIGLDPREIVRHAAAGEGSRHNGSKNFGNMDILNDDDLDVFFKESPDDYDVDNYSVSDGIDIENRHPLNTFKSPGQPKHRSDSQDRGSY